MPTADASWCLRTLEVENFRVFEHLSLELDDQLTLLIGKNGSGKTAILEALAVALWEPVRELAGDTKGARNIRIEDVRQRYSNADQTTGRPSSDLMFPVSLRVDGIFDGQQMSWQRSRGSRSGKTTSAAKPVKTHFHDLGQIAAGKVDSKETVLPVIAFYGVERMTGEVRLTSNVRFSRRSAYDWALDLRAGLNYVSSYFRQLDGEIIRAASMGDEVPAGAMRQYKAMEIAAESMLEPLEWKKLRWDPVSKQMAMKHPKQGFRPLNELPSGAKIAVGLALDIASRMTRANPHLSAEEMLRKTPGIVLVDEIDLHLHPSWKRLIVPQLRALFPAVQWVLSSHSPQVIATVEAEKIRAISVDGDVVVPSYAEGLRPEVVLERIQGTDASPPVPVRRELDTYISMVYAGDGLTDAAQELRADLDAKLGGAEWEELLQEADAILAFESAE